MIYNNLLNKNGKIGVVGLGYVGLPLAVEFAKHVNVIGFDTNMSKIEKYKSGIDVTNEVGTDALSKTSVFFTADEKKLKECDFIIVAVPTPINLDKTPNLDPVIGASEVVGRNLKKGAIVVYESTVYPGVTEDVCIPIIEKNSGLKCGKDWKIGYSPERINPGDHVHRVWNIKKIVSGMDSECLNEIADVYSIVIEAGVHKAPSIKVAEAAKVVENSQRDINIAFMNELAMVFDKMNIDTKDVVEAMNTKWNALGFVPGLVGGHCIGVDPYYFTYQAEKLGYHSQIILSGRKVNDDMGAFVANVVIREIIKQKIDISKSNILILGATFKENCPDVRNSKVFDIINELNKYNISVDIHDPIADFEEVEKEYGVKMVDDVFTQNYDCVILAVSHNEFKQYDMDKIFKVNENNNKKVIVDIKSSLDKKYFIEKGYTFWRL